MQRFNERIIKVDNQEIGALEMFITQTTICRACSTGKKDYRDKKMEVSVQFLIHASKAIEKEISAFLNIDCSKLAKGAIIGIACLYDVKSLRTSKEDFLADKAFHLSDNFSILECV